jgi:hypothetical protein
MLKLVRARGAAEYPAFLGSLTATSRETLEAALPVAWIPADVDVDVGEAVARRFGPAGTEQLLDARLRDEMGSALFATFLSSIVRLAGATPAAIARFLPMGWKQVYADCGTLDALDSSQSELRIRLRDLPPVCTASDAWMASVPVGFAVICSALGMKVAVTTERVNRAAGSVVVVFRWDAP